MKKLTLAIMALSLFAGVACDPGFESQYDIQDLRVLAVSATPPEFLFPVPEEVLQLLSGEQPEGEKGEEPEGGFEDLAGFALPVTLRLLVADEDPTSVSFQYSVTACVLDQQLHCDESLPFAEVASGESMEAEVEFSLEIPGDVLVASLEADPAFGLLGATVWLRGQVVGPERTEEFLKAVIVTPDFYEEREANNNPSIASLMKGDEGEETEVNPEDGPFEAETGGDYRFLPVIPDEDRETFQVVPFDSSLEAIMSGESVEVDTEEIEFQEITEQLTVRFYSNCGKFNTEEASEKLNPLFETEEDKEDKDLSVEWSAPDEARECRVWFVAFDNRGGIGWYVLDIEVK